MSTRLDVMAAALPQPEAKSRGRRRARVATLACSVLGHEMDNRTLAGDGARPRCARCDQPFLHEDGRVTHTRHVLGCFLRHHTYVRSGVRDGHNEYTCVRCGHPLLFEAEHDPYAGAGLFHKKVRYLCGLLDTTSTPSASATGSPNMPAAAGIRSCCPPGGCRG